MKDVIKLKQTEFEFVEDENGVEYIRYSLVASMQKSVIDENRKLKGRLNKLKSKIADQHPRKGLWDAEKVISFIKENVREYHKSGVFHVDDFIDDLRKTMEE